MNMSSLICIPALFRKDAQGNVQKELCKDYTVSEDA